MLISFLQNKIILILFKLTIFSLLVLQLYQLTKQYLLPSLRKHIVSVEKYFQDLQDKFNLTKKTQKRLNDQMKKQSDDFSELEDKVKNWHELLSEKHLAKEAELKKSIDQLKKKKQKQYNYLQQENAEKNVLPQAINEARKQLQEKYLFNEGKNLLTKVVKNL